MSLFRREMKRRGLVSSSSNLLGRTEYVRLRSCLCTKELCLFVVVDLERAHNHVLRRRRLALRRERAGWGQRAICDAQLSCRVAPPRSAASHLLAEHCLLRREAAEAR